jgi:hypothetical protein
LVLLQEFITMHGHLNVKRAVMFKKSNTRVAEIAYGKISGES